MSFKTYDLARHICSWGEILVGGYGPEGGVTVKRNGDAWSLQMGADGSGARSRMNDKSGEIEIEVLQSDPINDLFSAAMATDELLGTQVKPFSLKDMNGSTVHFAPTAWLKGWPESNRGKEVKTNKWVLVTNQLDNFLGGQVG
jgi:hypothetical protein